MDSLIGAEQSIRRRGMSPYDEGVGGCGRGPLGGSRGGGTSAHTVMEHDPSSLASGLPSMPRDPLRSKQTTAQSSFHNDGYASSFPSMPATGTKQQHTQSSLSPEDAAEALVSLSKYFEPEVGEMKMIVAPVRCKAVGTGWRSGRLIGTNYRLRVVLPKGETPENEMWIIRSGYLDMPWGVIKEILQEGSRLALSTKDRRQLTVDVQSNASDMMATELVSQLLSLTDHCAWPSSRSKLFPFVHAEKRWHAGRNEAGLDGWQVYDPMREYGRMDLDTEQLSKGAPWFISWINKDYQLCDTYPSWLVFPKRFPVEELSAVADFRKKRRLPVMSWCGPHLSHAGLFRSSQTTEGMIGAIGALAGQKCIPDVKLMMAIGNSTGQKEKLLVLDLRPRKVAYVNRVVGGGIEDGDLFRVKYCGIDNIHHVRDAYLAMANAVQNTHTAGGGSWFYDVGNSKWYGLLATVLDTVMLVVDELTSHRSVLVHCSDGWDRTAQNTSLVMLILDPFYRTFTGFFTLIQKEFCSFGHRFRTRFANGEKATTEYSPIFFQWLDAVYQIVIQNPSSFEFTTGLLLRLSREVISGKYGTFMCDSEKEYAVSMMHYTVSIWTDLLQTSTCDQYKNDGYVPTNTALNFNPNQVVYKIWDEFWFTFSPYINARLKLTGAARADADISSTSAELQVPPPNPAVSPLESPLPSPLASPAVAPTSSSGAPLGMTATADTVGSGDKSDAVGSGIPPPPLMPSTSPLEKQSAAGDQVGTTGMPPAPLAAAPPGGAPPGASDKVFQIGDTLHMSVKQPAKKVVKHWDFDDGDDPFA